MRIIIYLWQWIRCHHESITKKIINRNPRQNLIKGSNIFLNHFSIRTLNVWTLMNWIIFMNLVSITFKLPINDFSEIKLFGVTIGQLVYFEQCLQMWLNMSNIINCDWRCNLFVNLLLEIRNSTISCLIKIVVFRYVNKIGNGHVHYIITKWLIATSARAKRAREKLKLS